jgi:hypothetical protein
MDLYLEHSFNMPLGEEENITDEEDSADELRRDRASTVSYNTFEAVENTINPPGGKRRMFRYQPEICRHKYNISLWKIDEFRIVKMKETYFSWDLVYEVAPRPLDFAPMQFSLDGNNIILYDRKTYAAKGEGACVIVFNSFSLEKMG